ncbi:hypothetical protein M9H77_15584 [Catharanthus roseus]|uniref:Uncharacterized protein n=1 Tax=Catharanthus roseus TaxID=4058 RepID=A0ACC0B0Y6_CATRO|nr:hypothetical protein M9H77_15584 [Catharanthus roseus]
MGRRSSVIKWYHLKLLILIWVCSLAQNYSVWAVDSDKSALLEFKASLLDPSGVLSNWDLSGTSNHCSWNGVACDGNSRVVALNITGGGNLASVSCARISQFPLYGFGIKRACLNGKAIISGKLSSAVARLANLRVLSVPFNELGGEIPMEIWEMENLEVLDLEGNSFSGSLPTQFKGLRNLRVLNLGFNRILGKIPDSFSNFVSLQILNLAGNQVNGTIPGFIGGFRDLRGLYLSFNQLSGAIPSEIGRNCGKLEHLELAGNLLTEGIPKSLGNCWGLRSLLLYSNLLEEVIPAELGQLNQLEVLDLSRNSLSGAIPSQIGNCSKLSILVLSNLWDPIPNISRSEGDGLSGKLAFTDDEYNFYEGTIPVEITKLPSLRMLWVPRATLDGNLPNNWGSCDSLEIVNLSQNYYKGEILDTFSNCENLHFLDLSSNRLTGQLVDKLPVPCMTVFDVSGNQLSGSIPKFYYRNCSRAPTVNGDFNDPSSSYLSYFSQRSQAETSVELFADGASYAVFHNFGSNNFSGTLQSMPVAPNRIGGRTSYAFFAGSNNLTGPFPQNVFAKCGELNGLALNISKNGFSGQIPDDLGSKCGSLKLLDASWNQMTGSIPPSIGNLISLVGLNMSGNLLQASIPSSLGQLKDLRYLSLADNNLTGFIPTSLGQLSSLEVLELSSNSLTGEIPKDLANLRNLTVLLLDNNKLSGQIPPAVVNVSTLSIFNVSFNNLSGPLPSNGDLMKCNSVLGNPLLQSCHVFSLTSPSADQQGRSGDTQSYAATPSATPTQKSGNSGFNSIEIASITSAAAIFTVLLALIVLFFYTRKYNPRSRVGGSMRKEVTVFTDIGVPLTFENVVRATANFNASNCIGNGGFGATYKAEIAPGVLVAIKRLAVGRFQGVQQFDAEIKTLGRLRHPNLVTLIGYHASETEMFLIYNYLPGGNLEKYIQERSTRAVDWRILHKIALDIARALAYLHDQCVPRVLHRDVKPSNILLDEDYNAYLSDFGLARLLGTSETHATTGVAGTFGYVAPEYAMTCRVSDKADVYSYGVVLLELISDKKALDPSFSPYGNGFNIVAWACMLLRQGRAKEFFTAGLWDAGPHDDLVEVLHLAVVCTVDSLSTRPTMKQVVRRLKQLQPPSC